MGSIANYWAGLFPTPKRKKRGGKESAELFMHRVVTHQKNFVPEIVSMLWLGFKLVRGTKIRVIFPAGTVWEIQNHRVA